MICKNCGAEYDNHLSECPYCGAENMAEALRAQKAEVAYYRNKTEETRQKPIVAARKATHMVSRLALIIVAVFVVILIITFIFTRLHATSALDRQNRQLARLESYYQETDYAAMKDYLYDLEDGYGATYEKYSRVAYAYSRYEYIAESFDINLEFIGQITLDPEYVAYDLNKAFGELTEIREMESKGFPYGESDGMLHIKALLTELLIEKAKLTDDEIDHAIEIYNDDESAYLDLAEKSIERMEADHK